MLAPVAPVVVCALTAPAPESVVVTGADGWVAAAFAVVGDTVAVETAAGVVIVFWAGFAVAVVALDDDPREDVCVVVAPPLAGVTEPVGTVNGGLPLVSAVAPPPPPQEATPAAIAMASRAATP